MSLWISMKPMRAETVLSRVLALGCCVLFFGALAPEGAHAQQGGPNQELTAPVRVPPAILAGLLAGTPDGIQQLKSFIAAGNASPDEISQRAIRVVQQLKDSRLVSDPATVLAAADRIAQTVSESLNAARVMQLKVDSQFRVPEGAYAFDFGPADKPLTEGFERVRPDDPRVRGSQTQGMRRPGDGAPILSGGIAGIEGLQFDVPDGEYRVILMTESVGDAALSLAPFGQQVVANGITLNIFNTEPEDWLRQAVLSVRGLEGAETAGNRQGGAVTLTVRVQGGKLIMDFRMPGADQLLKTYLTGLVIQPIEQPPLLARPPELDPGQRPVDQIARSEAQVARAISELLDEPSGGPRPPTPPDFGPPVTEPSRPASAS
ncbi:MAG: hypothetical protein ACK4NA_03855 [Alphaproteobacteria bacterium]